MHPGYVDMVGRTMGEGTEIPSRYGSTFERRNVTVAFMAGEWPRRPKLNPRIGFMEGLFLVGTFFDLERIKAVAPSADHSLFTEDGAYGPRVRTQLPRVVQGIADDPQGRQHILYIGREGDQYTSDAPCTNNIQFLVRPGPHDVPTINAVVNMRSSDIIKGLPTDMIQFGFLTQVLGICLGLFAGVVAINAASSHLYKADMDKIPTGLEAQKERMFQVKVLPGLEGLSPIQRFEEYQGWAIREANRAPWDTRYLPVERTQ